MSISGNRKQHQLQLLLLIPNTLLIIVPLWSLLSVVPSSEASATPARTTLLPHCQGKCGDVSIPYPFGIGRGCYLEGFQVRCNSSYDPPRLFMAGDKGEIEMIDISLEKGKVSVYNHNDWMCFNETNRVNEDIRKFNLSPPYTFSSDDNKFVVVGCDDFVVIAGNIRSVEYYGGCVTFCENLESAINDTCNGSGCCDTTIPKGLRSIETIFRNVDGNFTKRDIEFDPCSYAFLVQRRSYRFSTSHLIPGILNTTTYKNGSAPVVLDWVIANETCEQARRNLTSFACVSANSECLNSSDTTSGYLCNYSKGYQGNPYLSDGCHDINECEQPETQCYGNCTNTPGNFICSCDSGRGNPNVVDGCIPKDVTFKILKVLIA